MENDERPYIRQYINDLEDIVEENWDNGSVLFEVFSELDFRKPRKRPRELRKRILERLLELADEFFHWPTTMASSGDGSIEAEKWPKTGLLSYLGYHVGKTGLPTIKRREILDQAYKDNLPTVNNSIYMAQWGEPRSSIRLKKIAESIAAFCRNQKRRDDQIKSAAIADWESDLAYMKAKYYDGNYDFQWPRT